MSRILVVDDEEKVRKELVSDFEEKGYEVTSAGSKKEAFEIIQNQPPFDIAVVDMKLSETDPEGGLDVVKETRRKDLFTEIIVITAFGSLENVYKAMEFGIYRYIDKGMKDVNVNEILIDDVKKALEHKSGIISGRIEGAMPGFKLSERQANRLGEELIKHKLITQKELDRIRKVQKEPGELVEIIISEKILPEGQLNWVLSQLLNIPYIYLTKESIDYEVAKNIHRNILEHYRLIPIMKIKNELTIVMANPMDSEAINKICEKTGCQIRAFFGSWENIKEILTEIFGKVEKVPSFAPKEKREPPSIKEALGYVPKRGILAMPQLVQDIASQVYIPEKYRNKPLDMEALISIMVKNDASDIHIGEGLLPRIRMKGALTPIPLGDEKPEEGIYQTTIYSVLTQEQQKEFEEKNELDVSFGYKDIARIRMNVFKQKGKIRAAMRSIPINIPSFDELGLPFIVKNIAELSAGLVLVTGPTGTGKSTTLASIIDYINKNRNLHITTVEDPIEFFHFSNKSIVDQREVKHDTESFPTALKYVLRQDPDVIMIGEMRDFETISAALTIAETGHLVFATLHTPDAAQSINRIVDVYPAHQQQQVRSQLSLILKAIFSQILLPKADGSGRVLACEVLIATSAVRSLIRDGKIHSIYTPMQSGMEYGMQTMNMALIELYNRGVVTYEDILSYSPNPEQLKELIGGRG